MDKQTSSGLPVLGSLPSPSTEVKRRIPFKASEVLRIVLFATLRPKETNENEVKLIVLQYSEVMINLKKKCFSCFRKYRGIKKKGEVEETKNV